MKKLLILGVLSLFLIPQHSFAQSDWSYWQQTDCLAGVDVRVKRGDYNQVAKKYKWYVEFKNRYDEKVHFNSIAVEPSRTYGVE